MSVKFKNRQYEGLYKLPSETENPDWLLGNTGDSLTALFDIEAGIDYIATQGEPIEINYEERTIKLLNGKKWSEYGFDLNRTIKMSYIKTETPTEGEPVVEAFLFDVVIENLFSEVLLYEQNTDIQAIGYEIIPTDRGTVKITGVKFYDEREPEGVRLAYGHISNNDITAHNPNSFIDGTRTEAIYAGLDSINDNSYRDMELIGLQSGMSLISARIKKMPPEENSNLVYNLPDSGEYTLQLPSNNRSVGRSITMNGTPTPVSPYQNQVATTFAGAVVPGHLFINNSDFTEVINLKIRVGTIIHNNYGGGANRKLYLLLHRWTGGASYSYGSPTVLTSYVVSNEIRGQQLIYDDTVTINVVAGESYSLAYAFEIDNPSPFLSPSVKYQTNFGSVSVIPIVENTDYKRNYQVELKFILSSFFEDREQIIGRTPPEIVFNANSLTDVLDLAFYPEWNNPNLIIKNDLSESERLGNTGWFNENYNGLDNDFTVKSLRYENLSGQLINTVSYGAETKVKVQIDGVQNLVAGQTKVNFGFIWVPVDTEDYHDKTTPFHQNTKINTPLQAFNLGASYPIIINGFSTDLARMDSRDIIVTEANGVLFVEFTLKPTPEFTQFFDSRTDDRLFALWVSVADSTLETNFSNRVNLLLDVQQMEFSLPVSGELEGVTNRFIEHPEGEDVNGVEIYDGFIEDDILSRVNFPIPIGQRLSSISFGYESKNINTGDAYELEKISASLNGFVSTPNGSQQINYSTSRGFKYVSNFNKNWVKVFNDPSGSQDGLTNYVAYFGTKIRWEEWIQRNNNVPSEYYNASLEHNGFNNNWLDYLENSGHVINFFILFDVIENGVLKRYKNTFPITFKDYDSNDLIDTQIKYYRNSDDADITLSDVDENGKPLGMLLSGEPTRIEITYTLTEVGAVWDLNESYFTTTLEIKDGAGEMEFRQLSSIVGSENDNPLIPLFGENRLKVVQISDSVINTSCLVDNTRLTQAEMYKITGRVGCFSHDGGGEPINTRIYEDRYELKYE